MKSFQALSLVVMFMLVASFAFAGGPQLIGNEVLGTEGEPLVWDPSFIPILYVTDGGSLGALTNPQANQRVQQAFDVWHNVSTASISFANVGSITGVAGGDVRTAADFDQVISDCQNNFETAVVYDADGSLFMDLYSDPSVVGVTGVCDVSFDGYILSGLTALNGAYADLGQEFDAAMTHEFGHLIGLDHSQIDCLNTCNSTDRQATPTMYPILLGTEQSVLAPDDIAWVSTLYPGPTFAAAYGHVSGTVLFSDSFTPVQGVNVVFRQADNPSTPSVDESRANVFSVVSGYRFTGDPGQSYTANYLPCTADSMCAGGFLDDNTGGAEFGSHNPAMIGAFDIYLPPGSYTVQVQSIYAGFTGGSSVGPLSTPIAMPGPSEYWNNAESATDDVDASSLITVVAGGNLNEIDIILNGTLPRFDPLDDVEFGIGSARLSVREKTVLMMGGAKSRVSLALGSVAGWPF